MTKVLNLLPYLIEGGGLATYLNLLRGALDQMQIPHETWETQNNILGIKKKMRAGDVASIIQKIKDLNPSHIFVHNRVDPRLITAFPDKTYFFLHDSFMFCLGYHTRLGKPCFKKLDAMCMVQTTLTHCGVRRPDRMLRDFSFLKHFIGTLKAQRTPIVAVSRFLIDFHKNQGLTENPYHLLYPYQAQPASPSQNLPKKYAFYVGGFNAIKGFDTLLAAIKVRKSQIPIRIAGFSYQQKELMKLIEREKLSQVFDVVGYVDSATLSRYYHESQYVIMPTLTHEAFGIVGLESMAHALPVIGSKVGGIPEWLKDGHTGFLINPGDHSALAMHMDQLADNETLCQSLGQNGYQRLQQEFSQEVFIRNLQKILSGASPS